MRSISRFPSILWLIVGMASGPSALGFTQNLDLALLPTDATTNRLDITVSASVFSDSDLTRVSGNALATIGYNIVGGMPAITSIEFTGGHVDIAGSSSSDVNLTLGNFLTGTVNIVGSDLGGTLDTPLPPSPVSNGQFATSEHIVVLNTGTLTANGSLLTFVVDEMFDLSQDNLELVQQGTATLELLETAVIGRTKTYDVTLTFPVDATETIEGDVAITVQAMGTIVARDTFSIMLPLAGDYNGDDLVNLADYTLWRDTLGASGDGLQADGNFDTVVDREDYLVWKSNFGGSSAASATPPGPLATSIPEPTSLLLGLLGGAGAMAARRTSGRDGKSQQAR